MSSIKYQPEIDGLRAIAVVLVVIYHAFPSLFPGGFIGVDIFFVISGYLISKILITEVSSGKLNILDFYRRRFDRIFPALLIVLYSCAAFGWFTLFADEYMQLGKLLAGSASFTANIVLFSETGYFNTLAVTKPLLHIWSLGVEEQFYIFFPIILLAFSKLKVNLKIVLLLSSAASFFLGVYYLPRDADMVFYLPQFRAWELLAGSLISTFESNRKDEIKYNSFSTAMSFVSLASIAIITTSMPKGANFPGWYALIPVLSAIALIKLSRESHLIGKLLSSRLLVSVGLVSYPLYLWHWPLLSFARIINGDTPSTKVRLSLIIASLILAIATFVMIEKPLKRIASWRSKTIPLILAMISLGLFGFYAFKHVGIPSRTAVKMSNAVSQQINGALWQYTDNENCKEHYHFDQRSKMPYWFCIMKYNKSPDMLLLGNSYANHLYPGIAFNSKLKDLNILSLGTASVVEGKVNSYRLLSRQLYAYMDSVMDNETSIKYVIISGLEESPNDQYINYLSDRVRKISSLGKKVIIFAPHVKLKADIKACFPRPLKNPSSDCITDNAEEVYIAKEFERVKLAILKESPDTLFFNPNSVFCNNKTCSSVIDGMPVYRDDYKHFSVYASMKVGSDFADWAKQNAPDLVK